jgi:hypothetical protein
LQLSHLELKLDGLLLEQLLLVAELSGLAHEFATKDEQQETDEHQELGQHHCDAEQLKPPCPRSFLSQLFFSIRNERIERGPYLIEQLLAREHRQPGSDPS